MRDCHVDINPGPFCTSICLSVTTLYTSITLHVFAGKISKAKSVQIFINAPEKLSCPRKVKVNWNRKKNAG